MSELRFEDFPFDEESERKLDRGGFRGNDPNRIRGIRNRKYARDSFDILARALHYERSGRAAANAERARAESEEQEKLELTVLADQALSGAKGKDAQHLASQCLLDSSGIKHYELTRLRAIREGLRKLRAADRREHGRRR